MRVPEDGGFVVVGVRVERGAEFGVVLVVEDTTPAAADRTSRAGRAVVDGAEAGCSEGGEDAGVCGDAFRDALAAAQAGGDQVEGVAAVDLRAGRAAGRAPVVAADQEVTGREAGGVETAEDVADLAGAGVDVVGSRPAHGAGARRLYGGAAALSSPAAAPPGGALRAAGGRGSHLRVKTCLRRGRSGSEMAGAPFASADRSSGVLGELPSRLPSTQAEPSRRGPGRQGRSYSGALHLDALNHASSTVCGSTADGMGAGESGG
ncbi:hypothetical protein OK006_5257 [Actinobacteria bacterium OK006]|nr:hypothetical protein OK006_5257 [Actinobacteria bacterium OK006]